MNVPKSIPFIFWYNTTDITPFPAPINLFHNTEFSTAVKIPQKSRPETTHGKYNFHGGGQSQRKILKVISNTKLEDT